MCVHNDGTAIPCSYMTNIKRERLRRWTQDVLPVFVRAGVYVLAHGVPVGKIDSGILEILLNPGLGYLTGWIYPRTEQRFQIRQNRDRSTVEQFMVKGRLHSETFVVPSSQADILTYQQQSPACKPATVFPLDQSAPERFL